MIVRWFRRLRCPHPPAAEKSWGYTRYGGPKRLVECRACGASAEYGKEPPDEERNPAP